MASCNMSTIFFCAYAIVVLTFAILVRVFRVYYPLFLQHDSNEIYLYDFLKPLLNETSTQNPNRRSEFDV